MTTAILMAAEQLRRAQSEGKPCAPVRTLFAKDDVVSAYEVQNTNVRLAESAGRRIVGCKIGLTAKSVQKQLGVDQPDYGILFADMSVEDGEPIPFYRVLQPKVEAEVALFLERDLLYEEPTVADLIRAIAYAVPAIEIVGSRIAGWDITIVDTIADNASSGAYVIGTSPRRLNALDLRLCGMAMFSRGDLVSAGAGAACLGHPLNAAVWLARTMVRVGRPLRAGELILTGALGPMVKVMPGASYEARINGLGTVRAVFDAESSHG